MEPKEPLGPPELPRGTKLVPPAADAGQSPVVTPAGAGLETTVPDEPDELNAHVVDPGDPDGLVAAEEKRKWDAAHPPKPVQPAAKPRKRHPWLVTLLVLLLIAAAAYGAYWFGSKQAAKDQPVATPQTTKQNNAAPKTTPQKIAAVPTKHYDSATYSLGVDYPQTWTLADTTAKLTIVSPTTALTTAKGTTNGHVVVTFQNKQTAIPGYPADGAIAALESKKLSYKQPTSIQRAQTYLSYLGYTAASGLDALYITGDSGYQQSQTIPMADVIKGDPLISVMFESCTSDDCSTGTPTMLTLQASKWQSDPLNTQIETLLKSIQLD